VQIEPTAPYLYPLSPQKSTQILPISSSSPSVTASPTETALLSTPSLPKPYFSYVSPTPRTQLRDMIDKKTIVQRQALADLRRRQREDAIEAAKIRQDPEAVAQYVGLLT
jgi:hypothetical protein